MADTVAEFYDRLANDYHLIFADWPASVRRQGHILDRLIRSILNTPPGHLLDCSCGIGTQSIGLALEGYRVHGSDLSSVEIERARREAADFGVEVSFGVADMRALDRDVPGTFDVVISCDNSLPHLLTDDDLDRAMRSMWSKLERGGLLLVSIRDYDSLLDERPRSTLPLVYDTGEGRRIVFQVWDWVEGASTYAIHHFITREVTEGWATTHVSTHYRALRRTELSEMLERAGFRDLRWWTPEESGYYQPLATARKS